MKFYQNKSIKLHLKCGSLPALQQNILLKGCFKILVRIPPAPLGRVLLHMLDLVHLHHVLFPPALHQPIHPEEVDILIILTPKICYTRHKRIQAKNTMIMIFCFPPHEWS